MKRLISFLFVLSSASATAQEVTLHSVLEHFTNTKCSICASRNPGLQSNLKAHPAITYLSIHPSAPYAACVLSMQNKTDNDDRTKAYGVYGSTPRIAINGTVIPSSADYNASSLLSPYIALTTPVSMRIEQTNFGKDSIAVRIIIKKHAATSADAGLFVGLAEDTVFVNGGNGETQHFNVLRKSLTGATHQFVSLSFAVGDSVVINASGTINSVWNTNRIFAIAMLFNNTSKLLMQSATSVPQKTTGIGRIDLQDKISVFPNPSHAVINIRMSDKEQYEYSLYTISGVRVANRVFSNHALINVRELPQGNYILSVKNDQGIIHREIQVIH